MNIDNIKIPRNFVLILPDPNPETIQRNGKDTGIFVSDLVYEKGEAKKWKERNLASYGTVYGVPERLTFNKAKLERLYRDYTIVNGDNGEDKITDYDVLKQMAYLRKTSVEFDVPIEISKGDRVRFSYQAFKVADEEGRFIETDYGRMFFVKYDDISFSVEGNRIKSTTNGYIAIEPMEKPAERTTASGIFIPDIYKGKMKEKRTKKALFCKVVKVGARVNEYLDTHRLPDHDAEIEEGDILLIDPRGSRKVENDMHQYHFDRTIYLIRRHQILLNQKNNPNFAEIAIGHEQLTI